MFFRLWFWLLDTLRVQFRIYKRTIIWLLVCVGLGVIAGIISLLIGGIGVDDINYYLVDGNILNMAGVNTVAGSFIWQRVLSLLLPVALLLILACLARFAAATVYLIFALQGYWLCMSVWWTICFYSLNAIFLLAFYLLWLLLITVVLIAGALWALNLARTLRQQGCRQTPWFRDLLRGLAVICAVAVVLGLIEYLVYVCLLGRIVYKPL